MNRICQTTLLLAATIASVLTAEFALAQQILPKGIGIYGYGYRHYEAQTDQYNASGKREPLGAPFTKEFTGQNLLDGAGGEDLQKLANELRKFDGNSASKDGLLNSLNLGSLQADVTGQISAQAFAFGYGVSNYLTLFASVPWVDASVNTKLSFSGPNNAQMIKQRLGDLAFDELKAGLDQASSISTQQIVDSITSLGYENPSSWNYSGIGDIDFGSIIAFTQPLKGQFSATQALRTTITMPTGYYEDPDILTDVSIGRGYYLLSNQYIQTLQYRKIWIQGDISLGYGLPTEKVKRVPEADESLVAQERTTNVTLRPGADFGYGGTFGYNPGWLKLSYRLGVQRHLRDEYTGSMPGNYDKLSEGSNSYLFYQEPTVTFDTVSLFNQKRFLVPFIAALKARMPIQAKNSLNERYYEMSVSSFFNTPYASTTKPAKVRRGTKHRRVEKTGKGHERSQKTKFKKRRGYRRALN